MRVIRIWRASTIAASAAETCATSSGGALGSIVMKGAHGPWLVGVRAGDSCAVRSLVSLQTRSRGDLGAIVRLVWDRGDLGHRDGAELRPALHVRRRLVRMVRAESVCRACKRRRHSGKSVVGRWAGRMRMRDRITRGVQFRIFHEMRAGAGLHPITGYK